MEKFKLPEPFRTDWINSLRSGKYKQAQGRLYAAGRDGYCCLGVAEIICGNSLENLTDSLYPASVLQSKVPTILRSNHNEKNLVGIVSSMNDSGDDFNKIADWLEKNTEPE